MRKPLMAGNWKMNKTWAETVVLTQDIINQAPDRWDEVDIVICPPMTNLKSAFSVVEFDRAPIAIGAQNVHWEPSGAYTGEVSVPMLAEIGVTYCIIGHSERREYFFETDEMVNKKAKALLAGSITPIICVGESLAVRDANTYIDFITSQVVAAFAGLEATDAVKCVVAYEPIWAIGTGRTATPEQAEEVCAAIRATLAEKFGAETASEMRILYGGSMNTGNVEGLIAQENIDGGLVGGAALDGKSFAYLCEACLQ